MKIRVNRRGREDKIIKRIMELDRENYCPMEKDKWPYMNEGERGCATCKAIQIMRELLEGKL